MSQEMIDLFGNSNLTSLLHNLEDNIKVERISNPMEPVKIPLGTPLMKNMVKWLTWHSCSTILRTHLNTIQAKTKNLRIIETLNQNYSIWPIIEDREQ